MIGGDPGFVKAKSKAAESMAILLMKLKEYTDLRASGRIKASDLQSPSVNSILRDIKKTPSRQKSLRSPAKKKSGGLGYLAPT